MQSPVPKSDGDYYNQVTRQRVKSVNKPAGEIILNQENPKITDDYPQGTGSVKKPQASEVI